MILRVIMIGVLVQLTGSFFAKKHDGIQHHALRMSYSSAVMAYVLHLEH